MTLQEIQYKAQGIIHKWRDDDSAPYIEFVEELAHMIVPEPSEDLGEAAERNGKQNKTKKPSNLRRTTHISPEPSMKERR